MTNNQTGLTAARVAELVLALLEAALEVVLDNLDQAARVEVAGVPGQVPEHGAAQDVAVDVVDLLPGRLWVVVADKLALLSATVREWEAYHLCLKSVHTRRSCRPRRGGGRPFPGRQA